MEDWKCSLCVLSVNKPKVTKFSNLIAQKIKNNNASLKKKTTQCTN